MRAMTRTLLVVALLVVLAVVALIIRNSPPTEGPTMNALAERYVRLVLALGQHDADYVDAYYGPPEWRKEAEAVKVPLSDIDAASADLVEDLAAIAPTNDRPGGHVEEEELLRLRHHYLTRQLGALRAR